MTSRYILIKIYTIVICVKILSHPRIHANTSLCIQTILDTCFTSPNVYTRTPVYICIFDRFVYIVYARVRVCVREYQGCRCNFDPSLSYT